MARRCLLALACAALLLQLCAAASLTESTVQIAGQPVTRRVLSSHDARLRDAPADFVRIGTLQQKYGPNAAFSELQFNAWNLFLAQAPLLTINGVTHGVQVIALIDGSNTGDGNATIIALTESLVMDEGVHVLATPFQGNSIAMIRRAESLGVPCLNEGLYDASFLPPFKWSLYMLPKLQNLGFACVTPLSRAGAKTYAFTTENGGGAVGNLWRIAIPPLGGTIVLDLNITAEMKSDPTLYDPLIDQLKAADPDVIIGTSGGGDGVSTEVDRIHRFRVRGYSPRGFVAYGVGSYPELRAQLGFEAGGLLISEAYQASLGQADPLWGSSQRYDSLYRAAYGVESSNTDAAVAASCTLIVAALNGTATNLTDPAEVLARMVAVNVSSIFGPMFFVNNTVQRPLYCFQNSRDASAVNSVWPDTSSAYTPMEYPFLIDYPKGWFAQFHKKKDHKLVIALSVTFGVLGLLAVFALVFIFVLRRKFHIVALKKTGTRGVADTWG